VAEKGSTTSPPTSSDDSLNNESQSIDQRADEVPRPARVHTDFFRKPAEVRTSL